MIKYCRLLLVVFILGLLVVPLFHMNTAEITEQENRTLAKFPEIKKKGKLNSDYGKEFESWLGDRFWGRDKLIDARFKALYKINGRVENDKAFVGDDGWMFEKSKTANIPSIEKQREKIEKDAEILKKFADKFKKKNIPIYLVLVPNREQLYQKYWEMYYKPKPRLDYGEELTKLLKSTANIKIIYPKNEFELKAEQDELFFKDDTHLTHSGSKLILDSFLQKTGYDYSVKLKIVTHQYENHYIASLLKLKMPSKNHYGNGFTVKSSKNINPKIIAKDNGGSGWPMYINYTSEDTIYSQNIYFFGGCVGYNSILSYLSYFFKNSYYLRIGHYKNFNEDDKRNFYFQQILPKIHSGDVIVLYMEPNFNPLSEILEKIK